MTAASAVMSSVAVRPSTLLTTLTTTTLGTGSPGSWTETGQSSTTPLS